MAEMMYGDVDLRWKRLAASYDEAAAHSNETATKYRDEGRSDLAAMAGERALIYHLVAKEIREEITHANQRIPAAYQRVEAFVGKGEIVVNGDPESDDESHNCDGMGCSSLDHVVIREKIGR